MSNKVIGVIGSRSKDGDDNFYDVWDAFKGVYEPGDSICSGLCPKGGDRFAVIIADRLGLPKEKRIWHKPDWDKHGKAAGFIRNTDIARDSDVLIACVSDDRTGGTEDTIKKFLKFHEDDSDLIIV
jgi:hypothetical protein